MSVVEIEEALKTNPVFNPERFLGMDYVGRREAIMSFVEDTHALGLKKHNQNAWLRVDPEKGFIPPNPELSCGTSGCFAGWGLLASGAKPSISAEQLRYAQQYGTSLQFESVVMPDAPDVKLSVPTTAAKFLGLNEKQASRLFHYSNTVEDLRRMVDELAAHPRTTLVKIRPSWMQSYESWSEFDGWLEF